MKRTLHFPAIPYRKETKMYDLDFKKIGMEMKRLRKAQGVTQDKIATDLGCTVAFISNVENARAKLNLRILNYYSMLCNVTADSILDAGRDKPRGDANSEARDRDLLNTFHRFTIEDQEMIIKLIKCASGE